MKYQLETRMVVRGEEAHCASPHPSLQQILNKDDLNGLSSSSDICLMGRNGSRRTNVCTKSSGSRSEHLSAEEIVAA
jgi:hypothetical protein